MQGVHNSVPARNTPKRKDIYIFYTAQYQVESVYKQISYFRFYGSKSKNLSRSTDIMISRKLITNQGCCCCFLFFFLFFPCRWRTTVLHVVLCKWSKTCLHIFLSFFFFGLSEKPTHWKDNHFKRVIPSNEIIFRNSNFLANEKYHYWNITTYGDSPSKIIEFG